jgi:two-component system sensor kinase FixL
MAGTPPDQRRLLVRTSPGIRRTVDIEVRDVGHGISPESMPRIFEPFFTTKPSGMGMGLSIVRSIVDAHGGRIAVSNNRSGGATFTVTLPAAATAKEAA